MKRRRGRLLLIALVGALSLSAVSAWATAQPVSPAPGAVVHSTHPLFTWSLPTNEHSQAIYLANKPDTTPEGSFYTENVVDIGAFYPDDPRQWSPTSGLYAGRYWWLVESYDVDTYQSYRSTPIDFTIPVTASVVGLRMRSYHYLRLLSIEARWRSNVPEPVAQASLSTLAGRRVWSARRREYNSLGSTESSSFDWYVPRRVRAGTRLRLVVRVSGASQRRVVRAP